MDESTLKSRFSFSAVQIFREIPICRQGGNADPAFSRKFIFAHSPYGPHQSFTVSTFDELSDFRFFGFVMD
ncbi:hypothetical protein [Streptomyces sp. NPDC001770]